MTLKNNTLKFISGLMIVLILLPSFLFSLPKKAEAIPVVDAVNAVFNKLTSFFTGSTSASTATNTAISIKNAAIEVGKQLLKLAAKRVLAEMTKSIINWINNGFHGKPLFLENPDSFFKNIAKTQVKSLVDMIGYDTFRFPFGKQTALNVIDSYKSQLAINAQYSLSKVINDPDLLVKYRNDFSYGGWNGFLINTQYPQNNYLGFNMMIQQNLASQLEGTLQSPAQKIQNQLQQSMGFLSPEICPSNPNYNKNFDPNNYPSFDSAKWEKEHPFNPNTGAAGSLAWEQQRNTAESAWYDTTFCPGGLVKTTPGAVVANQIFSATNTPFLSTALDGALGNSLEAIFNALLNKLIGDGLTSLKTTINPASTNDNWNYYGNTLSGGSNSSNTNTWDFTSGTTTGGALTVSPQNVVLNKTNGTVIATIKGGLEPYSLKTEANEAIAIVVPAGNALVITGVTKGTTFVEVQDASSPVKTLRVNIEVKGPEDLFLSRDSVSIDVDPETVTINGGVAPYTVGDRPDSSIASAQINGQTLTVYGLAQGDTSLVIKDSSNPVKAASVVISVINPGEPPPPPPETPPTSPSDPGTVIDPLRTPGTCTKNDNTTIGNITQQTCMNTPGAKGWVPIACTSIVPKGGDSYGAPTYTGFLYGVTSNVSSVRVATWSEDQGQDDIIWYDGKKYPLVDNAWSFEVDLENHHPVTASNKKIIAHAYMYSPALSPNGTFCGEAYFFKTD